MPAAAAEPEQIDQDDADPRRDAGGEREHEQEELAVAQPGLGRDGRSTCRGGPFGNAGRCNFGHRSSP